MIIWTPDHPYAKHVLNHAPQWWRMIAGDKADPGYLVTDEYGVLHPMSQKQFIDYCYGGELEEEVGVEEEEFELIANGMDFNTDDRKYTPSAIW